jgi:hypothetical protein
MCLSHEHRKDEADAIAQEFHERGSSVEDFMQSLAGYIERNGSFPASFLARLAELAIYVEFVVSETLIQKLVNLAVNDQSLLIRKHALQALAGARPRGTSPENGMDDLWAFVLQNDEDTKCRKAAIDAIYRKGLSNANYDALVAALSDVHDVCSSALVVLAEATPTPQLVSILTGELVKHPGTWTFWIALGSVCNLIRRGFRLTAEWRNTVARLLVTVTEFSGPDGLKEVAMAHARGISRNAATADEAISELMQEFNQCRFSAGAKAYISLSASPESDFSEFPGLGPVAW